MRRRLVTAMTGSAARHGYGGASVARVVGDAGVSRATFYEHFGSRDDCFRAAYRCIVSELRARLAFATGAGSPWEMSAALEVVLRSAAERPDCARLVLVEALGASPPLRREHEEFLRDCEASVERHVRGRGESAPRLSGVETVGAIVGIVSARLLAGEAALLPALRDPLLAWIDAYAPAKPGSIGNPDWEELGRALVPPPSPSTVSTPPALLPRGNRALGAASAGAAQRQRIVAATTHLVARDGYRRLTVARIVAAARVSRRAFYSCFESKQEAFLAAQAIGLQESIAAAAAEFSLAPSWPEAVWVAGRGMLTYIGAHPETAHLAIIEVHAAGEAALRRQEESRNAYGLFLQRGYAEFTPPESYRAICTEAISTSMFALLRRQVLLGRTAEVPGLLPASSFLILAPFLGPAAAAEFIAARARADGSAPPGARPRSRGSAGAGYSAQPAYLG